MRPAAKRVVFWGITLAVPFALLAALELTFRATGLFAPEPLFLEIPESHGAALKFNPWVTRRYFDSSAAALPNLTPETFVRTKSPATFRILCLGESTTAGFPFESTVPFPSQLREIMANAYPKKRVEVLNAGISAVSSYVVLDLLPELLQETNPDLVIVYLGHNEFYGVFGSGSTLFPGKERAAVLLTLKLQRLHIARMMKRAFLALKPPPAVAPENRTLMQDVVGDQEISLDSPEYRATMEAFRANLESIADVCGDAKVPVLFGNLIANYRDQPPFHGLSSQAGQEETARILGAALQEGDSLLDLGRPSEAESRYRDAFRLDSGFADAWFGIGRARFARGDTAEALLWFTGAKDLDAMRFRASEEASRILADIAASRKLGYVDLIRSFADRSPGGIIGRELICDHLHPNPLGYYLMASAFFQGVVSMGVLPAPDPGFRLPRAPYGVTDLDWEIGLLKVFPMLHEWPFKQVRLKRGDYRPHGDTAATRIAIEYHRRRFAWVRAHDMMAHIYIERGDLERARQEYLAVAVYQPDDPWPHQQVASLYEREGNWLLRSAALQQALVRSPAKGLIAYQLALSEWRQGHLEKALTAMEFAADAPELTRDERQNAKFHLAGFLSDAGRRDEAIRVLHSILAEAPGHMPSRKFLAMLERRSQ